MGQNDHDVDEHDSMGAANSSSVLSDENLHTSFGETESNYRVIEINATNPIHGNHS